MFSSRSVSPALTPSSTPASTPGAVTPAYTPQRRISIQHPSGVLEVGLAEAAQEAKAQLGPALVERTVALIAHARVYYTEPRASRVVCEKPVEVAPKPLHIAPGENVPSKVLELVHPVAHVQSIAAS